MRWKTLDQRLEGAVIRRLRYEPNSGFVVIELADGRELLVSACWEGCHVLLDDSCASYTSPFSRPQTLENGITRS
jgi:hypothetical protein